MKIHELMDKNLPCCFYCGVEFDLNAMSLSSSSGSIMRHSNPAASLMTRYDTETLYCVDCKEKFEIYSNQKDDGETTYTGFSFTCKGLNVYCNYDNSTFDISNLKGGNVIAIPAFEPDFSNRDKLHEKLRTYLIFS